MKNCLIYTVKNDQNHLKNLEQSLSLFRDNLNPFVDNIDILFFYDLGLKKYLEDLTYKLRLTNEIILKEFTTVMPVYPTDLQTKIKEAINLPWGNRIEYKNMCRFWAGEVFKDLIVNEYDYYLRLDCDSFITSPVGYNLFSDIDNSNKICAYIIGYKFVDDPAVSKNLNQELLKFEISYNKKLINSVNTLIEGTLYNTNFEICKIKSFSKSDYMNLYNHIDQSGGIYLYRWGDHIIRYAGIHMLFGTSLIKEIKIGYTHQSFVVGV